MPDGVGEIVAEDCRDEVRRHGVSYGALFAVPFQHAAAGIEIGFDNEDEQLCGKENDEVAEHTQTALNGKFRGSDRQKSLCEEIDRQECHPVLLPRILKQQQDDPLN